MSIKNTITIDVDSGYAFDYLSILEVKKTAQMADQSQIAKFLESIQKQVGIELTKKILVSEHYKNLITTNQEIFDLLNQYQNAPQSTRILKKVYHANKKRHIHKQNIQHSFFESNLTETKNWL